MCTSRCEVDALAGPAVTNENATRHVPAATVAARAERAITRRMLLAVE